MNSCAHCCSIYVAVTALTKLLKLEIGCLHEPALFRDNRDIEVFKMSNVLGKLFKVVCTGFVHYL